MYYIRANADAYIRLQRNRILFLQNNTDVKTNRKRVLFVHKVLKSQLFIFNKNNNGV